MTSRTIFPRKRIAIVAHDNRKAELMDWAFYNRMTLSRHQLYGTGTTGKCWKKRLTSLSPNS